MQVYHFDATTKLLTGLSDAHSNPMQPGQFLVPAFATEVPPPPLAPNEAAKWENDHWIAVPVIVDRETNAQQPVDLASYAADLRWRLESSGTGMIFGNIAIPLATDRDSQMKILSARYQADIDPTFTINWKCSDGTWHAFDTDRIKAASNIIISHINKYFEIEHFICKQITAGVITSTQQIDAAFAKV